MNPLPIILSSFSEALVPFIFQLPATSGRIPGVMVCFSGRYQALALTTKIRPQSNRQ
ncbi:msr0611 [Mesorhizobium japonicum MAFF 303099]|uniref:Msr0611 protein n=1 Tax=Mesorhizobium japonicum (strain LMG 29417 / CECT 9101 / MAFF 303099) TaxID=266835 RepID=Q98ME6_RHILO|nr:msr0611 [Mesorhizobium japonicum MAFF 303099]